MKIKKWKNKSMQKKRLSSYTESKSIKNLTLTILEKGESKMHDYRLMKEDNTTLLFDTCFVDDEDIAYAYNHRFNVLYTDTRCTNTFALIKKFLDLGYTMEVIEKRQTAPDGIKLDPLLYAKLVYHDNY